MYIFVYSEKKHKQPFPLSRSIRVQKVRGLPGKNGVNNRSCSRRSKQMYVESRYLLDFSNSDVSVLRLSSDRPFGITSSSHATELRTNVSRNASERVNFVRITSKESVQASRVYTLVPPVDDRRRSSFGIFVGDFFCHS